MPRGGPFGTLCASPGESESVRVRALPSFPRLTHKIQLFYFDELSPIHSSIEPFGLPHPRASTRELNKNGSYRNQGKMLDGEGRASIQHDSPDVLGDALKAFNSSPGTW